MFFSPKEGGYAYQKLKHALKKFHNLLIRIQLEQTIFTGIYNIY